MSEKNNKDEFLYHLEIRFIFEHDYENLEPSETIRNITTPYKLIIKNVGDIDFPGGVVEKYYLTSEKLRQDFDKPIECPRITVNSEHILYEARARTALWCASLRSSPTSP